MSTITNKFAYDDPHPRCEPDRPFRNACYLITDCGSDECPRHAALRAAIAEKKEAKSAAARAANSPRREA